MQSNPNSNMGLGFPEPLADRYRPRKLDDFIGLQRVRVAIEGFIARPTATAWYFVGPSGSGKTSMALAIAEALKAELHHIPSRSCDLETIEHVCKMCNYVPMNGGFHLVLVDEADQMTGAAQMALLSKLDATAKPPNTIFIFTANSRSLLEGRFLSRCKVLEFDLASVTEELPKFLSKVYKREGGKFALAFDKIVAESTGNVRDALGKLEIELLIDAKRSELPIIEEAPKPETHQHKCGECDVKFDCADDDCSKAFVARRCPFGGRPPCKGTTTERADAGRRAWETRRENAKRKGGK